MISLNKFMIEVKNKLKRMDEKHNIKESISLNGTWTAPHDGILTCNGRATQNGAYLFCKDITDNEFVGLCTIANNQQYGSFCFAVITGHQNTVIQNGWSEPRTVYVYQI